MDLRKETNMSRINAFKSMDHKNLEQCYYDLIAIEIKKENNPNHLSDIIKQYQNEVGDKAAFAIMKNDMLMEIAKRWTQFHKFGF